MQFVSMTYSLYYKYNTISLFKIKFMSIIKADYLDYGILVKYVLNWEWKYLDDAIIFISVSSNGLAKLVL